MAIQDRTTTITGVFAQNATTTIPTPPVTGVSYRDTSLSASDVNKGWPFKEIVDSSQFNQALYEYSSITKQIETYGFLPWSSLTDYEIGSLCLGTNGVIYQAKQATGPSTTSYNPIYDQSGTYWEIVTLGSNRKVGEIIASTIPLNDSGLHLLDGSLISGSGAYSQFVTYIANLVSGNPDLFETEANWQSSVSTYGVCGKFVYDSVNNTVRLPKITGFIEGVIDPTKAGDLNEAGLPNIEGMTQLSDDRQTQFSGAFFKDSGTSPNASDAGTISGTLGFDASRSSSVYGNSETVQPQSINVLYYIVIANSTKTDIEIDIDDVMSDLAGKADIDLSNSSVPHVVETYDSGTDWYRLWSDGWCEQGGVYTVTSASPHTILLLKTMSNTNYNISATPAMASSGDATVQIHIRTDQITTSSFGIQKQWSSNNGFYYWSVQGFAS